MESYLLLLELVFHENTFTYFDYCPTAVEPNLVGSRKIPYNIMNVDFQLDRFPKFPFRSMLQTNK